MPWHINIGKRLVKRPKIYIRDSGIFHSLQSIENYRQLITHSKLGASWEGFALENICKAIGKKSNNFYFWRTHAGAELDLLWQSEGKNWGVEFKYNDAPKISKSMQIAIEDIGIEKIYVIYPGKKSYKLAKNIIALPLFAFPDV